MKAPPADLPLPSAPYRGIEPFRYIDHPIFFARKDETLELVRKVVIYRGCLLYGTSGAGKSSLINAGLIPEIVKLGFTPERVRVKNQPGGEIVVERISLSDEGQAPFLSPSLAGEGPETSAVFSLARFKELLREHARDHSPLLIFDQFEELITQFEESPRPGKLGEALTLQEKIIEGLVELLHDESLRVKVLFVFREDYLARLTKLFVSVPELAHQFVRLTPPKAEALDAIIRGPVEGPFEDKRLEGYFPRRFPPSVVEGLVTEFRGRSEGGFINLWVVQIVCLQLWNAPDPEALYRERRVEGMLKDYFNTALGKLKGLKDPAMALLGAMVTPTGARNVISKYSLFEQVKLSDNYDEATLERALEILTSQTRLVRVELRQNDRYYDILSEFLSDWIVAEKKNRQVRKAALELKLLVRDVSRRRRRYRYTIAAVFLVPVLLLLASLYILRVRNQQRIVLEQQQQLADAQALIEVKQQEVERYAAAYQSSQEATSALAQGRDEALLRLKRAEAERDEAIKQRDEALKQQPVTVFQSGVSKVRRQDRRPKMFGSAILDVAIGVFLVFLLLSLVCTALHEFIAAAFGLRARDLERGVRRLLGDDELARKFYRHPLIRGLTLGEKWPSYIPARTFALALVDIVAPATAGPKTFPDFVGRVASLPEGDLRQTLLLLAEEGERSMEGTRRGIEAWFDNAMDRVSGAYKQRTQVIILGLGLLLAVALNVDAVNIGDRLSRDAALRNAVVAQAQAIAEQPQFDRAFGGAYPVPTPTPSGGLASNGDPMPAPTPGPVLKSPEERIRENVQTLEGLGLPLGWAQAPRSMPALFDVVRKHLLGWLITALAVSLGAPFLFDVLNKFIVVRSTVKPREKSPEQPSKDKPSPDTEEEDDDMK